VTDGGQKTSRPPGQPDHSADQESPDPLDAEVTVEQVDDHAKAKKLADNPQPSVTLFDPAPAREAMRTLLAGLFSAARPSPGSRWFSIPRLAGTTPSS